MRAAFPDTVRDAVLARAASLSPSARRLLDAVAIVPVQAELSLLEALAGDAIDSLDECLGSGVLAAEPTGVAFRHELARLAVEEAIPLNEKIALHRAALAALAGRDRASTRTWRGSPTTPRRLPDTDAVSRYAPAAAERAASLGAHREAAAQYARALRHGQFSGARARRAARAPRARVLPDRSVRRGDRRARGSAPLSPRARATARRGRRTAATVGVPLVPRPDRRGRARGARCRRVARGASAGPELAHAYANLAFIDAAAAANRARPSLRPTRALELAERSARPRSPSGRS